MTQDHERLIEAGYRRRMAAGEFGPGSMETAARKMALAGAVMSEAILKAAGAREAALMERIAKQAIADRDRMAERMARAAALAPEPDGPSARYFSRAVADAARLAPGNLGPRRTFAEPKIGA